ncbi:MAG: hypothetical protein EZS28_043938, partial [Streblomastix strix]
SAYLEKPRQCAHSRSPETQDRVQGRLRSTFEFIQDYLVRAGRRRHNPGPGLFRQVLESDIRDPEEERRLAQDPGLSNSEQRAPNRVFQTRRDYRYSGNNTTQRLGNNNRPASSLPSHQSSGRDATLSMLQLQWSLLQLQRNAVWSFNGPENLYQMPSTGNSRSQEAMQLENSRLRRRYSDPELGSRSIAIRDTVSNNDTIGVRMDDRNGQEPDQSHADSRVHGLAVEHKSNDNVNNNVSKERSLEITKTLNGTSQEKETCKNKGLGIGNWRDPIYNSTIQTRRASHQVAPKAERQGSSQQRLEQVDSTQQERDTRHNLADQQACPEPTTALHEAKQMDNGPNRCVELRMGSNIDQREPGESICARGVEGQQPQEFQSKRSDSSSESASRIPSRIDLITAYWNTITHRQHSYNELPQQGQRINDDRAPSRQGPQASRTIQLDNRSQPYSWPFEHYTRQLVKVIQMRRLRNQERSPLEDTQGTWDLDLYRHICDTREPTMHE